MILGIPFLEFCKDDELSIHQKIFFSTLLHEIDNEHLDKLKIQHYHFTLIDLYFGDNPNQVLRFLFMMGIDLDNVVSISTYYRHGRGINDGTNYFDQDEIYINKLDNFPISVFKRLYENLCKSNY